jgi:hypothetical protein
MMLTDEGERRGSKPEAAANHRLTRTQPPSSRGEPAAPAAADVLPGSLRNSQADGGEQSDGQQSQAPRQQRLQCSQGSLNAHILHGVKSGVWGMPAHQEVCAEEQDAV